ncbi:hypothetical protein ACFPOU_23445 [Massilia jejuensis]|uniref:Uncharacterized protein n=1 Tax=Massilia jejuensis TaxID=648894 RepID=A0ABW0PNZ0_9BURK
MNLLDGLARTDIDPAMLAKVRTLVEQQQAQLLPFADSTPA